MLLNYDLKNDYTKAEIDTWHLVDDKSKTVNNMSLDSDILSGAIILQTSLTGETWITDVVYTDICSDENKFLGNLT